MRLFTALDLPEDLKDTLVGMQSRLPAGRPVDFDALHLTLVFLGEQSEQDAEAIHDALDGLRGPPVSLMLDGPAEFGGKRGKALGLNGEGGAALSDLQARMVARLRGAGVMFEKRRFRPHVTLVRSNGRMDTTPVLDRLIGARAGPAPCTSFGLYQSHLGADGAWYEALANYPLA